MLLNGIKSHVSHRPFLVGFQISLDFKSWTATIYGDRSIIYGVFAVYSTLALYMSTEHDAHLRVATQIALLGMVTKSIRAISFDAEPDKHKVIFRVHFDGKQHEIEIENMSAVTTEVMSSFPWGWDIEEQFITCEPPEKPDCLRLIGYFRCESPDFLPPD